MSTPEVVLHIGAFKTGTSFVQRALQANKQNLAEHGVLFPGRNWHAQVQAVRALTAREVPSAPIGARPPDAWDTLVQECRDWDGPRSIISMEFLSAARAEAVAAAVAAFAPKPVGAVLGARDITSSIPAQWQESLQVGGRTWTLSEYTTDVMRPLGTGTEGTTHFWRKHNWQRILSRWSQYVPAENLTLLTFPRPGADPRTLWRRFGLAGGFDAEPYTIPAPANESLGAASLEVVRRVNALALARGTTTKANRVHTAILCKKVMAARRRSEPRVVLPEQALDWASQRTERLLRKVERIGPRVVGSLDDLRPAATESSAPQASTSRPEDLDVATLLGAAEAALTGLAQALDVDRPDLPDRAERRLAAATAAILDITSSRPLPP